MRKKKPKPINKEGIFVGESKVYRDSQAWFDGRMLELEKKKTRELKKKRQEVYRTLERLRRKKWGNERDRIIAAHWAVYGR